MTRAEAIVLGVIQGLTEFLPISSTAHLKVVPDLLGWADPGAAFTAVIQWGTWLASVVYFRHDIARLTAAFFRGLRDRSPWGTPDARLAWLLIAGSVPIVVFGLLLEKHIKGPFRSLYVIAGAAIGLALVLAVAEGLARRRARQGVPGKDLHDLGLADALLVGFAQVFALVPGASRSGTTITGGLFAGMGRSAAARFSFLLSLPAVFGAGVYQLVKERRELLGSRSQVENLVIATAVSGVVGYAAIAFLIQFLKTHTTWVFIAYRLVLGAAILVLLSRGVIEDKREEVAPPASGCVPRPWESPGTADTAVARAGEGEYPATPSRMPPRSGGVLSESTPPLRGGIPLPRPLTPARPSR